MLSSIAWNCEVVQNFIRNSYERVRRELYLVIAAKGGPVPLEDRGRFWNIARARARFTDASNSNTGSLYIPSSDNSSRAQINT
jgi:hypothetical protein